MQLDHIFEDLEAQFDAELSASQPNSILDACNLIRVRRADGQMSELILPLLGVDFVAGMRIGFNDFQLLRLASASTLEFHRLKQLDLPTLKLTGINAGKFIRRLPVDLQVRWNSSGSSTLKRGTLVEVIGELLIFEVLGLEHPQGVPISAIEELLVGSVDNFSETD